VQTLIPFAAFVAWRLFAARPAAGQRAAATTRGFDPILPGSEGSPSRADTGTAVASNGGVDVLSAADPASAPRPLPARRRRAWPAALAGLFVMLAVGLPWYAYVLHGHPPIVEAWRIEVTREGATQLPPDPWYMYGAFFVWTVPWLAWFLAGLWVGGIAVARATPPQASDGLNSPNENVTREGTVLAFLLFVVPVVVMSFFRDKPERYLLPVLPSAALVAARAAVAWWEATRRDPGGGVVDVAHWVTLLVLAVGLPVAGLLMPRLGFGERWFSPASAVAWGLAGAAVVGLGLALRGRLGWTVATTAATAALILLLQFPVIRNYSRMDRPDLKPLADVVWARHPDAAVYEYEPAGRTRVRMDLPIYLGRLTKKTDDPVALRPSDRPQVVVFFQRHAAQAPTLPEPWQPLATGGNRKEAWRAYVLPPVPRQ
jgi:hypothetical protein